MNLLIALNSRLAAFLDVLARLAAVILPINGTGVIYTPRTSWRLDAWKEGDSWVLQAGSFELAVDLKRSPWAAKG